MTLRASDFPTWAGTDRILDVNARRNCLFYVGCAIGGFVALVAVSIVWGAMMGHLFVAVWDGAEDRHHILGVMIVPAVWLAVAVMTGLFIGIPLLGWRFMVANEIPIPPFPSGWLCRDWKLYASDGNPALIYNATDFSPYLDAMGVGPSHWSVSLDEIARVESGRTAEWIPHRYMAGGPVWASGQQGDGVFLSGGMVATSPTEYQAFVFCNDGSRLVFVTMHDGREMAQKWAAKVRRWVEAQRAAQPETLLVDSADERGEGFNI